MIVKAPQIGFDRFIRLDWVAVALRVKKGLVGADVLNSLLEQSSLGKEAEIKTRTKLNALVFEPRPDLAAFVDRGINMFSESDLQRDTAMFAWGAALATYPYFGKVAEITGRLTAMQGDCSMPELHRRMSELFGERVNVKRATRAVIQTQADWGAVRRISKGNRIERCGAIAIADPMKISWLINAALRYQGRAIALANLQSTAVLYPFVFESPMAYIISNNSDLELRSEGAAEQFVALRTRTKA